MMNLIVFVLSALGLFFVASAAVGALRFPDVFTRMHAITKAGTLGLGLVLAATAVFFGSDISLVTRAIAIIVFALLTAPASAQMIGRAAYLVGAERAPETLLDEIRDSYERPEALFSALPAEAYSDPAPEEH